MNKLIRDIPDEVIGELQRRAEDMHLQLGTYMRLLLIHAAVREEKSVVKKWATEKTPILSETRKEGK